MVLIASVSRLIPHPPNFTPIIAMGLFVGVYFKNKDLSLLVPLIAMLLSDLFLGFHSTMIWVYLTILAVSYGARFITVNFGNVIGASLFGSLIFFITTNFGVWLTGSMYPQSFSGLNACYIAGLPFLQNAVMGDLIYTGILN